jgi:glycosyl transferase family 25
MKPFIFEILKNYKVKKYNFYHNKNTLNSYINKIYIINLVDNIFRRNYIILLMKKYQLNFTLIVVERITDHTYNLLNIYNNLTKGEVGCTLSHLWCINDIINNEYNNAIIFEDDIVLHKDFNQLIINTLSNNKYDFLLLGACDFSFKKINYNFVKNNLYRPHESSERIYGAHAIYYSLNGAKKMFEDKIKNFSFFDKNFFYMFNIFEKTSFICYPNLVVSDITTSNLQHKYDLLSYQEVRYYTNCFIEFNFNNYNFIYLELLIKNKNLQIKPNDTYETYINKILYNHFSKNEDRLVIYNRLVKNFFTIEDIKNIIHN